MDTVCAFQQMLDLAHQPLVEHLRAMDMIAVGGELVADVFTRTFSALEVVFLQPAKPCPSRWMPDDMHLPDLRA